MFSKFRNKRAKYIVAIAIALSVVWFPPYWFAYYDALPVVAQTATPTPTPTPVPQFEGKIVLHAEAFYHATDAQRVIVLVRYDLDRLQWCESLIDDSACMAREGEEVLFNEVGTIGVRRGGVIVEFHADCSSGCLDAAPTNSETIRVPRIGAGVLGIQISDVFWPFQGRPVVCIKPGTDGWTDEVPTEANACQAVTFNEGPVIEFRERAAFAQTLVGQLQELEIDAGLARFTLISAFDLVTTTGTGFAREVHPQVTTLFPTIFESAAGPAILGDTSTPRVQNDENLQSQIDASSVVLRSNFLSVGENLFWHRPPIFCLDSFRTLGRVGWRSRVLAIQISCDRLCGNIRADNRRIVVRRSLHFAVIFTSGNLDTARREIHRVTRNRTMTFRITAIWLLIWTTLSLLDVIATGGASTSIAVGNIDPLLNSASNPDITSIHNPNVGDSTIETTFGFLKNTPQFFQILARSASMDYSFLRDVPIIRYFLLTISGAFMIIVTKEGVEILSRFVSAVRIPF